MLVVTMEESNVTYTSRHVCLFLFYVLQQRPRGLIIKCIYLKSIFEHDLEWIDSSNSESAHKET